MLECLRMWLRVCCCGIAISCRLWRVGIVYERHLVRSIRRHHKRLWCGHVNCSWGLVEGIT